MNHLSLPFDIIRKTRESTLDYVKDLSIEQLNIVPTGFNNNIAWNLGHLVATLQGVCYKRSGLDPRISGSFFMAYKPDTKPERFITHDEIDEIKRLLFSTVDQLETDYDNKIFTTYPAWVTRYGASIGSLDDAISFLPFHEGLHFGYIMALKRAIMAQSIS